MSRILHVCVCRRDLVRSFDVFRRHNKGGIQICNRKTLEIVMTNGDTHVWQSVPERLRGMEFDAAIVDEFLDFSPQEDARYMRDIISTRVRPK